MEGELAGEPKVPHFVRDDNVLIGTSRRKTWVRFRETLLPSQKQKGSRVATLEKSLR
jgi:hypothetical protein